MNRLNKFVSILLICIIFLTACDSAYDKLVTQPLNDLVSTAIPEDFKTDEKNKPSDSLLPVTRSSSPGRTGIAFSEEGYPDTNTAMQGIASTGVSFIRLELPIEKIQETTSHHEFWDNGYNEKVVAARKNNLHIIGLLTYGPDEKFYEVGDDSAFFELWRKYVQAVVDQLGDSIDHWEIGNEQNCLFFWNKVRKQDKSVRVDIYAEMLNIAYKIIKKHNINDVVIVGGLIADTDFAGGYPPSAFMKALAQTSAAESYDAVAIHPYWGDYLPESPKEMRTADNLKRVNLANYMDDFIKDVQYYANRDVKIYVTEMGMDKAWLTKLNKKMRIDDEWLEVALMARSFATLLSFPEVQAVIWFVYAPVEGGETFVMSDYAKEHMKRISQTLDQAEPLGFYTIKDESGDHVKGAWEYRYRLPNGKIVTWFWDQAETYEESPAYLKGAKNGSVGHFFVDEKIEGIGAPVDKENPFPFGSLPGILIGDISDEMVITVASSAKSSEFAPYPYVKYPDNIWIYYPDTGENREFAVRGEGHYATLSEPRLSPDGSMIAYSDSATNSIVIRAISGEIINTIVYRTNNTDVVGDLVGWDNQNQLYYTKGANNRVYKYNVNNDSSELFLELPLAPMKDSFAPLWVFWISGSADYIGARYATAYEQEFLINTKTNQVIETMDDVNVSGGFSMTEDDQLLAVPLTYGFQYTSFEIVNLRTGEIYPPPLLNDGYSAKIPMLSPKGNYVSYLVYPSGASPEEMYKSSFVRIDKLSGDSWEHWTDLGQIEVLAWSSDESEIFTGRHSNGYLTDFEVIKIR